jgi:hypothetical protein
MYFGTPLYWRESHKQPRFLIFDGRLVITLFLTIMHLRPWTVALTLFAVAVLWFFERKGVSPDSIARFLRARIVGRKRSARGLQAERLPVDFGFETEGHVDQMRQLIENRSVAAEAAKAKKGNSSGKK